MKIYLIGLMLVIGFVLTLHLAMNAQVGVIVKNPKMGNALFWTIGAVTAIIIGLTGWDPAFFCGSLRGNDPAPAFDRMALGSERCGTSGPVPGLRHAPAGADEASRRFSGNLRAGDRDAGTAAARDARSAGDRDGPGAGHGRVCHPPFHARRGGRTGAGSRRVGLTPGGNRAHQGDTPDFAALRRSHAARERWRRRADRG